MLLNKEKNAPTDIDTTPLPSDLIDPTPTAKE